MAGKGLSEAAHLPLTPDTIATPATRAVGLPPSL
jgi:hypothetical protein